MTILMDICSLRPSLRRQSRLARTSTVRVTCTKRLQSKACDFVMPDFMRIGGVTGWLRSAAIAGAAGTPMSTHLYPEVAAHVMRVTETGTLARMARLGRSDICKGHTKSKMACCTYLTYPGSVWNGTKTWLQPIVWICKHL